MVRPRREAKLLGVGLDNEDGHVRLTRGDEFQLVGGSQETHEAMQEKAVKFSEKVRDRGKRLADLEKGEFLEIAADCRMKVVELRRRECD